MTRVPRKLEEPVVSYTYPVVEDVTCDKCGKPISYDEHDDNAAHELSIILDGEQCVNFYRRRDYCDTCNTLIWTAISELIGADPWVERDKEY